MDPEQMNSLGQFLVRAGNTMCNVSIAMVVAGVTCLTLSHFGILTEPNAIVNYSLRDHDVVGTLVGCVAFVVLVTLW